MKALITTGGPGTPINYTQSDCFTNNAAPLEAIYGAGNWICLEVEELPSDFSVDTYTVEKGKLVKASASVIAQRTAAATKTFNENQRIARQTEYRTVTDPLVIELLAESTPEIKAQKDEIRAKYPYK